LSAPSSTKKKRKGKNKGAAQKPAELATRERRPFLIDDISAAYIRRPRERGEPFRLHAPVFPPGVRPPTKEMALDEVFAEPMQWFSGALGNIGAEGQQFMGYPQLSMLAQRPEYRRISETLANEMTRKWIKFASRGEDSGKADKIAQIEDAFRRLGVQECFRVMAEQDGFFGRSHLFFDFGVSDDREELMMNIGNGRNVTSEHKVPRGSLKGLRVIEAAWCYPMDYDASDPLSPDWYRPRYWMVMGKQLHSSRLYRFVARDVPDMLKPSYAFGGLSMTQIAKPYVDNWLRTRQSISDLINSFSVLGLKTNLVDQLNLGVEQLMKRLDLFNNQRSNSGMMAIDKELEDFFNVSTPLSTLDKLQAQAQEQMCSVSGIPVVKLLGIQPAGLNASSAGELQAFETWIASQQEALFREPLERVLAFVMRSEFGEYDEDITFQFVPLSELSPEEKAKIREIDARTGQVLIESRAITPAEERQRVVDDKDAPYSSLQEDIIPDLKPLDKAQIAAQVVHAVSEATSSGLISEQTALKELKNSSRVTDIFSSITEEDIAQADNLPPEPETASLPGSEGGLGLPAEGIDGDMGLPEEAGEGDGPFDAAPQEDLIAVEEPPAPVLEEAPEEAPEEPEYEIVDPSELELVFDAWEEAKHPRADDGKWTNGTDWKQVATQKGSNPGGVYEDQSGKKHYVKFYRNPNQGKAEAAAARVFEAVGCRTLSPEVKTINGKPALVTDWNEDLERLSQKDFSSLNEKQRLQLAKMFLAAVLTKNWDVVGLEYDNIVRDKKTGDLVEVDTGGSFTFRAQGSLKEYGPDLNETTSLRDPAYPAGKVFSRLFAKHPDVLKDALTDLRKMPLEEVQAAFDKYQTPETIRQVFVHRLKALGALEDLALDEWNEAAHPRAGGSDPKNPGKFVSKFSPGQVVTHNGKKHYVVEVLPDGKVKIVKAKMSGKAGWAGQPYAATEADVTGGYKKAPKVPAAPVASAPKIDLILPPEVNAPKSNMQVGDVYETANKGMQFEVTKVNDNGSINLKYPDGTTYSNFMPDAYFFEKWSKVGGEKIDLIPPLEVNKPNVQPVPEKPLTHSETKPFPGEDAPVADQVEYWKNNGLKGGMWEKGKMNNLLQKLIKNKDDVSKEIIKKKLDESKALTEKLAKEKTEKAQQAAAAAKIVNETEKKNSEVFFEKFKAKGHANNEARALANFATFLVSHASHSKEAAADRAESELKTSEKAIKQLGLDQFGITPIEHAFLYAYTESYCYRQVNDELRERRASVETTKFAAVAARGLRKLPNYKGTTYRGVSKVDIENYKVGFVRQELSFTSSGKKSGFSGAIQFTIHGKTGKDINALSSHKGEAGGEVLFPPNTMFHVDKVEDKGSGRYHITMTEVDDDF
jgi:phage-related protein (TIGR01555 family)